MGKGVSEMSKHYGKQCALTVVHNYHQWGYGNSGEYEYTCMGVRPAPGHPITEGVVTPTATGARYIAHGVHYTAPVIHHTANAPVPPTAQEPIIRPVEEGWKSHPSFVSAGSDTKFTRAQATVAMDKYLDTHGPFFGGVWNISDELRKEDAIDWFMDIARIIGLLKHVPESMPYAGDAAPPTQLRLI